jgi:hypothetical protein
MQAAPRDWFFFCLIFQVVNRDFDLS